VGDTLAKDRLAMSHPFFGTAHLRLDLLHRKTTHSVKLDAFEHIPDPFPG
jgi:hypothetical protein